MGLHSDRLGLNRGWEVPERLPPSRWAEQNVSVAVGNALPGLISFSDLAYQREILDVADSRKCNYLTVMSAAQSGKTTIALALSAYYILQKPRSIIILQPSESDVRIFQAAKFDPLIRANPDLERAFVKQRSPDGKNNQQVKDFSGGHLMFSWSHSTGTLKGRSAPCIINDEVDEYPHSPQGHPADLLAERSATFGDSRLCVELSTPTDAGVSRIEHRFHLGDQREWLMRCVECEAYQKPEWSDVSWDEADPLSTARWVCRGCGYLHQNFERIEASRQGKWVAEAPFLNHASFHISGLASPLRRLGDMCVQYADLISTGKPLNTFENAVLGIPHITASESARDLDLTANQVDYDFTVPDGVRGLVGAVDVQKDRLECAVWGFDKQSRSWLIGYWRLEGAPTESRVWEDLWKLLSRGWERRGNKKQNLLVVGIDSGYLTLQVEAFVAAYRRKASRLGCRLYAIKGIKSKDTNIVKQPTRGYKVGRLSYTDRKQINAVPSKVMAMNFLHVKDPEAPGYCTFPLHVDDEFFDSLTAEEQTVSFDRQGNAVIEWKKVRERNEVWDLFRYSYAMAMIAGIFNDDGDEIMNVQGTQRRQARIFT